MNWKIYEAKFFGNPKNDRQGNQNTDFAKRSIGKLDF